MRPVLSMLAGADHVSPSVEMQTNLKKLCEGQLSDINCSAHLSVPDKR